MFLNLVQFPSSDHSFSKLLRPPMCQAHRNLLMHIPYHTAFFQWIKYKTSSDSSLEPYFRGQYQPYKEKRKRGLETMRKCSMPEIPRSSTFLNYILFLAWFSSVKGSNMAKNKNAAPVARQICFWILTSPWN